jgi:Tfp pilus assembly protein PilF
MEEKQDSAGLPEFLKDEYEQMKKAVTEKWTIAALMMQKAGKLLSYGTDSAWLLQLKPKINFLLARGYLSNETENKLSFEQALSYAREAWHRDSSAAYTAECLALMYTFRNSVDRMMRRMFAPEESPPFGVGRRNDTAFYYFRKAIQLAPHWVNPYRSLAMKMYGYHSLDTAKQYMQKAISLDPSDATSYILMGDLVTIHDSSLYYYNKALAKGARASHSEIYRKISSLFLSQIYFREWEKKADSAILYGRKAIAADSSNTRAYTNVAWAYDRLGKPDSVLRYSLAAIRITPGKFHPYWIAVGIYNRHNKPDSAFHYSKKLLAADPSSGFAASQIARYYDNKKGFADSALLYFRKSLALEYDKEYCREKIAYLVMARDKQSIEPLELFNATLQETPHAWRSYYNIACYYANSGNAEQATAFLEKALQRGLKIRKLIDQEPFFTGIRSREPFKALLAKYFPD